MQAETLKVLHSGTAAFVVFRSPSSLMGDGKLMAPLTHFSSWQPAETQKQNDLGD